MKPVEFFDHEDENYISAQEAARKRGIEPNTGIPRFTGNRACLTSPEPGTGSYRLSAAALLEIKGTQPKPRQIKGWDQIRDIYRKEKYIKNSS